MLIRWILVFCCSDPLKWYFYQLYQTPLTCVALANILCAFCNVMASFLPEAYWDFGNVRVFCIIPFLRQIANIFSNNDNKVIDGKFSTGICGFPVFYRWQLSFPFLFPLVFFICCFLCSKFEEFCLDTISWSTFSNFELVSNYGFFFLWNFIFIDLGCRYGCGGLSFLICFQKWLAINYSCLFLLVCNILLFVLSKWWRFLFYLIYTFHYFKQTGEIIF